jgi:16S rRNA (uracil1498-N3)-methyltransferase
MQRFFVQFPLTEVIEISDQDMHHQISRVLRAKKGDHLVLFNGDRKENEYEVSEITKKSIHLFRTHQRCPNTEPTKKITLYQALPNKMEKIEYILEKWVEVGIQHFIFFRSDFSQKLIISDSKKQRFYTIAREALEQCGWLIMPSIEFRDAMEYTEVGGMNMTLDTTGALQNLSTMPQNDEIWIWVGPEWGWSESERSKMIENGFIFARFWERILRTETAWVVLAFALQNL